MSDFKFCCILLPNQSLNITVQASVVSPTTSFFSCPLCKESEFIVIYFASYIVTGSVLLFYKTAFYCKRNVKCRNITKLKVSVSYK